MEKKIIINSVTVLSNGIFEILLKLVLIDDDGAETQLGLMQNISPLAPGTDLASALTSINSTLTTNGKPEVSPADWNTQVVAVAAARWTDEVVSSYRSDAALSEAPRRAEH